MFDSPIVEAAIGLFLVYLLFSVLCSAINEWIVGHLRDTRAKVLETGITRLLGSDAAKDQFFNLPLIQSLSESDKKRPSYISSRVFVDSLIALLGKNVDPETRTLLDKEKGKGDPAVLRAMIASHSDKILAETIRPIVDGSSSVEQARERLEHWFDEGMDRATGWYKKHTQIWTVLIAFSTVFAFNVDTFTIARELLSNSALRSSLAARAEAITKTKPELAATQSIDQIKSEIGELQLPVGWHWQTYSNQYLHFQHPVPKLRAGEDLWMKMGGLIITACAVSMGAPFWFSLIGKLINLRSSGTKPKSLRDLQTEESKR